MTNARMSRIAHFVLNTADVALARAFYVDALGFSAEENDGLRLGAQRIRLRQVADAGAYPEPRAANDPWFQHLAIVVADMAAAYDRLSRSAHIPISRGGPQQLPPSTGDVIAYKFRDPEGHPLELAHIPGSESWGAAAGAEPGAIFLGIDHTAVAATDLDAAIAAFRDLGFTEGPRFLNTGPEQDRLDGLDDVVLDIATMMPSGGGPHIELLHYRAPGTTEVMPSALSPIAATRTVLTGADGEERALVLASFARR